MGDSHGTANETPMEYVQLDEETRLAVRRGVDFLTSTMGQAGQQTFELARWLLASLLAINGGSLLAFLSSDRVPFEALRYSAPLWLLGLVLAVASGIQSYRSGMKGIRQLGRLIDNLNRVLLTGEVRPVDTDQIIKGMERGAAIATWLAIGSCIAFVAGALAAAVRLLP